MVLIWLDPKLAHLTTCYFKVTTNLAKEKKISTLTFWHAYILIPNQARPYSMPCFIKASNTGIESDVFVRCVLQSAFVGIRFNSYLSYSECFFYSNISIFKLRKTYTDQYYSTPHKDIKDNCPHKTYTKGSKKKEITCRPSNPLLAENSKNLRRRAPSTLPPSCRTEGAPTHEHFENEPQ